MNGRATIVALAALVCMAADPAPAPVATPVAGPVAAVPPGTPYLAPDREPDASVFLPAPPKNDTNAKLRDIVAFQTTRSLRGTDRWRLATADADLRPEKVADDFSCAAGLRLDGQTAPALVHLLDRLEADAEAVVRPAKLHFAIPRPEVGNDAPICVARDPDLDRGFAYPSSHTTIGWASALVLTELMPDHATALLRRGRIIGESRIVCGVHWVSDIQGGRITGAAVMASLQAVPDFQTDLILARQEIARLRQSPTAPDGAACATESAAEIAY